MSDDLLRRLRTFGVHSMDDDGNVSDFHPNPLTTAAADAIEARDAKIEQLRAAFAFAVRELSTHGEFTAWTPEMLMNQFLEMAHRG